MQLKVVITEDGSTSLWNEDLSEIYHSMYGAINESKHVYIEAGLKHFSNQDGPVCILEVGFGTGLNAFLTYLTSEELNLDINYTALEPYPVSESIVDQLNYPELLTGNKNHPAWKAIHTSNNSSEKMLAKHFIFSSLEAKLEDTFLANDSFDLVYFDAFAPEIQIELWESTIFEILFKALKKDGVLVTYSAKGEVRRSMQKAGFEVHRIPGPRGKREMLKAIKNG